MKRAGSGKLKPKWCGYLRYDDYTLVDADAPALRYALHYFRVLTRILHPASCGVLTDGENQLWSPRVHVSIRKLFRKLRINEADSLGVALFVNTLTICR